MKQPGHLSKSAYFKIFLVFLKNKFLTPTVQVYDNQKYGDLFASILDREITKTNTTMLCKLLL